MDAKKLRRLAAHILGVGEKKILITDGLNERIGEAITKDDVRQLIKDGIVVKRRGNEHSRGRARILHAKRKKGRKRGMGRRYGTKKMADVSEGAEEEAQGNEGQENEDEDFVQAGLQQDKGRVLQGEETARYAFGR